MPVTYIKQGSDEFIVNGKSKLRVGRLIVLPSPITEGRVVRVFEILERVRVNPKNPSPPRGAMLALSFPQQWVNANAYTWDRGEECQVPLEITDPKAQGSPYR